MYKHCLGDRVPEDRTTLQSGIERARVCGSQLRRGSDTGGCKQEKVIRCSVYVEDKRNNNAETLGKWDG